jgi:hypothetical protein
LIGEAAAEAPQARVALAKFMVNSDGTGSDELELNWNKTSSGQDAER